MLSVTPSATFEGFSTAIIKIIENNPKNHWLLMREGDDSGQSWEVQAEHIDGEAV